MRIQNGCLKLFAIIWVKIMCWDVYFLHGESMEISLYRWFIHAVLCRIIWIFGVVVLHNLWLENLSFFIESYNLYYVYANFSDLTLKAFMFVLWSVRQFSYRFNVLMWKLRNFGVEYFLWNLASPPTQSFDYKNSSQTSWHYKYIHRNPISQKQNDQ